MNEVTVAGEGCVLLLRIAGYERPQLDSGADANWLQGEVEMVAFGAFRGSREVSLRTDELKRFRDQLAELLETLNGEASLDHMEEEVGCMIRLKAGAGDLEVFVREHISVELRVTTRTDQSYLQRSLRDLDAVVASFPVKGDPLG